MILVTGAAGFIGFHLSKKLISLGYDVLGVDNLNDYYDPKLKLARLRELGIEGVEIKTNEIKYYKIKNFNFLKADIINDALWDLIENKFEVTSIIHLAAQAGVRYSLENPKSYIKSNIEGFLNVLEFCRLKQLRHLIYASSSSVYGIDSNQPFNEKENCNNPISLYAATKRSNELMAFTYNHLYGISSAGLRFFTVYGPWGRPDMAPFLFTKAAVEGKEIKVFNYGKQKRDFTYIDDIIEGIIKIFQERKNLSGSEVYNIGQGKPLELMEFLKEIEENMGKEIKKEFIRAQPGDVESTFSSNEKMHQKFNFLPKITLAEGIKKFIIWYKLYYKV